MRSEFQLVQSDSLQQFCQRIFEATGMSEADASTQAEVLVWANLRGVDSHGVLRIPRYVEWLRGDIMNPSPNIKIVTETPACDVIDADRAPGAVAMTFAMDDAMKKAREAGVGWVMVRRTTHAGPAGFYTKMAAQQSMVGIAIITSRPTMAYHGTRAAGLATSPIAIAVPGGDQKIIGVDMATSAVALGTISQARATGEPLAPGVALTRDGQPTTDPDEATLPLPMAGPKGSGLSLLFECMLSILMGHPLLAPALTGGRQPHAQNGLCAALDIAAFTAPAEYQQRIDELAAAIKALPASSESNEVLLPGEREDLAEAQRRRAGIPIPGPIWQQLLATASDLGVEPPATGETNQ